MNDAIAASRFRMGYESREAAIRGFEAHNARVRNEVTPGRLLAWRVGDGWAPLCDALGVPVPDEPFPHTNTREEWRARSRSR
jgi:hypothetical protein